MADERTDGDRDVLSSLPHSRPARRSAKREERDRRVPPAGYATPEEPRSSPGTGELLGSAVRAAGEVAQMGAGVGKRAVCGALDRLTGR